MSSFVNESNFIAYKVIDGQWDSDDFGDCLQRKGVNICSNCSSCISKAEEFMFPLSIITGVWGLLHRSDFQVTEGELSWCHCSNTARIWALKEAPHRVHSLNPPAVCNAGIAIPSLQTGIKIQRECSNLLKVHSLNNHLLNVHCVLGTRIIIVSTRQGCQWDSQDAPQGCLVHNTWLVTITCSFSQNSAGRNDREPTHCRGPWGVGMSVGPRPHSWVFCSSQHRSPGQSIVLCARFQRTSLPFTISNAST